MEDKNAYLADCKELIDKICDLRATRIVNDAGESIFDLLRVVMPLRYRMYELSIPSYEFYDQHRIVAAFLLSRAAMETTAIMFTVANKIHDVVSTKSIAGIVEFFSQIIFAAKKDGAFKGHDMFESATNILKYIDILDKDKNNKGFRHQYDKLSEFTHPNFAGLLGTFGVVPKSDSENHQDFDEKAGDAPQGQGYGNLLVALRIFSEADDLIRQDLSEFTRLCNQK